MANKLKQTVLDFITNDREYPVFAGLSVGCYLLLFYYSNNFDLANSWQQFLFFTCYFVAIPCVVLFLAAKIIARIPKPFSVRQLLFIGMLSFFAFFVLQFLPVQYSYKRLFLICFVAIILLSFKFSNYKIIAVLLLLMSVFAAGNLAQVLYRNFSNDAAWNSQPDGILAAKFATRPNVYYIQTDGYSNASTLEKPPYSYDNSKFNAWLHDNGFIQYKNFRSNYNSTLKSNSSSFNMKHHFSKENVGFRNAADFIINENAALEVFRQNGYKSFFITEKPYLLMNRPEISFDYCNFSLSELPFLGDGWAFTKPITTNIKQQVLRNAGTPNFFFIEKFDPGHIAVSKHYSKGAAVERILYLQKLEQANNWLRDIVGFLDKHDPNAIIIIGADHGGFVGFDHTGQAIARISDQRLLRSVFGAALAVKWNDRRRSKYDVHLRTSVNMFRVLFAFLSDDEKYLKHLQPDISYNEYSHDDPSKIYKAIE
ncbi:MAG TPA: hypothetical protein VF676_07765 [Flavobacterium sp.]|jgi:hypothetical protein